MSITRSQSFIHEGNGQGLAHSCVVDEDVDTPPGILNLSHHLGQPLPIQHGDLVGKARGSLFLKGVKGFGGGLFIFGVVKGHPGALGRKLFAKSSAKTSRATGNQDSFVLEEFCWGHKKPFWRER